MLPCVSHGNELRLNSGALFRIGCHMDRSSRLSDFEITSPRGLAITTSHVYVTVTGGYSPMSTRLCII
jgi:hypothetical protein